MGGFLPEEYEAALLSLPSLFTIFMTLVIAKVLWELLGIFKMWRMDMINTWPMPKTDAFWLSCDSPTNLMIINGIMTFEKAMTFEKFSQNVEQRLLPHKRFVSIADYDSWRIDPDFDIRAHVRRVALPGDGTDNELQLLASQLMLEPLDPSKPLWRYYFVTNYYGEGCAVIVRIHHVIGDGISLIKLLMSCTDETPDGSEVVDSKLAAITEKKPPKQRRLSGENRKIYQNDKKRRMMNLISKFMWGFKSFFKVLAKFLLMKKDHGVFRRDLPGVYKDCTWSPIPLDLTEVKAVKEHFGVTVNDVLVASLAGGLSKIMNKDLADKIDDDIPKPKNYHTIVPVNLVSMDSRSDVQLGNHFGLVYLNFPLYITDPEERLMEVQRRMNEIKNSVEPLLSFSFITLLGLLNPSAIADFLKNLLNNKLSGLMSNVPGPKQQMYFCGQPIKNLVFWAPPSGEIPITMSIISYNNKVSLAVASDPKIYPDPSRLVAEFNSEFNALKKMVEAGSKKKN
eukprot:Nk52_evm42s967 gene=Nk52_evmTU42s967